MLFPSFLRFSFLFVLALSAACGGTSPARVGGSPLSLAALAGVSPALPEGEPSARPWTEANFVVRRTFLRLRLATDFAAIDAGTLGSPRGAYAYT